MSSNDTELRRLREHIDIADKELLQALAERLAFVREIGEHKKKNALEVRDEKRRSEVLVSRIGTGKNLGISGELVKKIFEAVLSHSETLEK